MFGLDYPGARAEWWYATMAEARRAAFNLLAAGKPWVTIMDSNCETLAVISVTVAVKPSQWAKATKPNQWATR